MQRDDFVVRPFPGLETIGTSAAGDPLRVVIVTEEILGPVRNGGIASTYYHLARGLAARGHDVHVLFLKGPVVQDETPEFWVERYADVGVTLHYLGMPSVALWGAAVEWQARYAAAYEWLCGQEPFDVVHTSEWRGGAVYALMAKRLGHAFHDTLFVVKTSSPHIWNRHYQMQPITQPALVAAAYAEQKCVELADLVVGGSAHLISFMERIGYRLPAGNVYVQPNIVDFSNLAVEDRRPGAQRQHGDVVRTRDLVFFGRLEARKGIELFCGAIDLLHERGEVPDSITFLGKVGASLATRGGVSPEQYLADKSATWTCPVRMVTDRDQAGALALLCEKDAIAVMPSLIENSTMAVYETLEQRIPFIASAVGGTPELIAEIDHDDCLVEPTAQALADRLHHALRHGQVIARPRFSNDDNLEIWYGFHDQVSELIRRHGGRGAVEQLTGTVGERPVPVETISHVALVRRDESLDELVQAFGMESPDEVVLGFNDPTVRAAVESAGDRLIAAGTSKVTIVNCLGQTTGRALDTLVEEQTSAAMIVSHGVGVLPQPGFFTSVRRALGHRPDCLLTTFLAIDEATLGMPLGGDVASQVLTSRAYGPEVVALLRATVDTVGGFDPADAARGVVHEFVTRAVGEGHDLLVLPEQLLRWNEPDGEEREQQADPVYAYLKAKPLLDRAGLAQRKVLLASIRQGQVGNGRLDRTSLHLGGAEDEGTHWLTPAGWDPDDIDGAEHRRLIVGLDTASDELWFFARGRGERRLLSRGATLPVDEIASHGSTDSDDHTTLSRLTMPQGWVPGASYPLIWGLYDGGHKLRSTFLRVHRIGPATAALSARSAVLSTTALSELFHRWGASMPEAPAEDLPPPADRTDEHLRRAVEAARQFVRRRSVADPTHVVRLSRGLLLSPPADGLEPISPRSGLKPPVGADGWPAGDWLEGWAWDREDRERILHVVLLGDSTPLMMVAADQHDRRLDKAVPGRGRHAFRMPVLAEFLEADRLQLGIWEGHSPVYRGALHVDRTVAAMPMLRRNREGEGTHGVDGPVRRKRWWRPW
jgi:glycosyltransferase involved in cell wall biosynthesis